MQQPPYPQQQQAYYPPPQQNPYNPTSQSVPMQQAPYIDPEDPDAKGFEFTDQSIRKGFIRKVFSILTVSQPMRIPRISLSVQKFIDNFVIEPAWIFTGATAYNFGSGLPLRLPWANPALGPQKRVALARITGRSFRDADSSGMLWRRPQKGAGKLHPLGAFHYCTIFHDGRHERQLWTSWSYNGNWSKLKKFYSLTGTISFNLFSDHSGHHVFVDHLRFSNKMGLYNHGRQVLAALKTFRTIGN